MTLKEEIEETLNKNLKYGLAQTTPQSIRENGDYISVIASKLLPIIKAKLPEKKAVVVLTEPPQGIDYLWLEGRDVGVTAGYNQCFTDVIEALEL